MANTVGQFRHAIQKENVCKPFPQVFNKKENKKLDFGMRKKLIKHVLLTQDSITQTSEKKYFSHKAGRIRHILK